MILTDFRDNIKVMQRLGEIAASGNVSHAYIFEGDTCTDKAAVAKCFAKAVLCEENPGYGCENCTVCRKIEHDNHEDVYFVTKDGNSIKDEAIEELQERLHTKALGKRSIAIVEHADTMTVRAQNRFLKTLEEPPEGTVIMLLSENTDNMLPTIVSRCAVVRLAHSENKMPGDMDEIAADVAETLLAREPFYKVKAKLGPVMESRDEAYRFLDALENFYGRMAKVRNAESSLYPTEYIYAAVDAIEEARRDLARNVSVAYTIKGLALRIL